MNVHAFMQSEISFLAHAQVASTVPNLTKGNETMHQLLAERLTSGVDVETPDGTYVLNDLPGHGFEIDADAVARAHERWQRDGPYNTIESVKHRIENTIVVGGGIMGAPARLYELARAGEDALLLEAGTFVDPRAATARSGALVRTHYSNAEVVGMAVRSRAAYPSGEPVLRALRLALSRRRGWSGAGAPEPRDAAGAKER